LVRRALQGKKIFLEGKSAGLFFKLKNFLLELEKYSFIEIIPVISVSFSFLFEFDIRENY
jgi:hypothetical protein